MRKYIPEKLVYPHKNPKRLFIHDNRISIESEDFLDLYTTITSISRLSGEKSEITRMKGS
jgi:hypothetical protein